MYFHTRGQINTDRLNIDMFCRTVWDGAWQEISNIPILSSSVQGLIWAGW